MRYVKCKKVEKDWSVITFGCWQIAPSEGWGDVCSPNEADSVIKMALERGITAFDTAEGYGDGESERRLGKALGSRKNDVIIISKIWPDAELTLKGYQKQLEDSLRALDRDFVDVYLIHWPGSFFNTREKSRQLCDIMGALKESGKTSVVGLSNFYSDDLSLLQGDISLFSVNQVPYSLLERSYEDTTLDMCRKAGVQYMAYSPTGQGLLAGRIDKKALQLPTRKFNSFYQEPTFSKALKVYETVQDVAAENGREPIEVALAWVLKQENILTAIVGSRKQNQVADFASAGDLDLSADHLDRLTSASSKFLESGATA